MMRYKYQEGWDHPYYKQKRPYENAACCVIDDYLIFDPTEKLSDKKLVSDLFEKIMNTYDEEACLMGLFNAIRQTHHNISPFIVTHKYCIKNLQIKDNDTIQFNISPIYHLGPEYAHQYKEKHGIELNKDAIIGLMETSQDGETHNEHKTFHLGIDAGIIFGDSKVPHNKMMELSFAPNEEGVTTNLTCESQTTSKRFSWKSLSLSAIKYEEAAVTAAVQ